MVRRFLFIFWGLFFLFKYCGGAEFAYTPFSVGERLKYSIRVSGFNVGYQTIELVENEVMDGIEVYRLNGISRTSPFVSIIYRLDDRWTVFIDKNSLLPVRVEKDMIEGNKRGFFIYTIDQREDTVRIENTTDGKEKFVHSNNDVFDLFSLIYFYRQNPERFNKQFTFDFLEPKTLRTVHFRDEGKVEIEVPGISKRKPMITRMLKQMGGAGIEIYMGTDNLRLPLKMVVPSELPKNKVVKIEFNIENYAPGDDQKEIPEVYKRLHF